MCFFLLTWESTSILRREINYYYNNQNNFLENNLKAFYTMIINLSSAALILICFNILYIFKLKYEQI